VPEPGVIVSGLRGATQILLCAFAASCGGTPPPPPPPVFPLATAWTAPLDHPLEGPLALAGDRVVVHTRDGAVQAFAILDGKSVWRAAGSPGVIGAGPAVVVLRGPDGALRGYAPDTGRDLWQITTTIEGDLPPVVEGTRVLVAGRGAAVLDAATGRPIWSVSGGAQATAPPAQVGPCVLIGETDILRCREAGTGRSSWVYRARGTISSPPVSDGRKRLLLGTAGREFLGLDLADGEREWRWKVGADVRWPAVVWRDLVIFATHENVLYGLKKGGGSMVWRAGLPSRPLAPPLLVGQDVLVACYGSRPDENYIVGYDAGTGERLGDLLTPGELSAPPLLAAGRLLLPLRDHRVVALRLPMPPSPAPARARAALP
jgi:outer membrane protein assembly factor BamB